MTFSLSPAWQNASFVSEKRILRKPAQATPCLDPVAMPRAQAHGGAMVQKSPLDDPVNAAHAWARYRQIMKVLMSVTVITVALALGLLFAFNGAISVHYYIAVALGISFTMLLGGGLMGLAFLSNGTGHDESVDNRMPGRDEFWTPDDK
ncbi:MAG: hypothetical protein ACXIUO_12220 [Erythrobacter sp.]